MPGDAVEVALEKAAEAVMAEMGWKDDGAQDFEPVETAKHVARAAVVAFLRGLPIAVVHVPGVSISTAYLREEFAAAVARAGGGA